MRIYGMCSFGSHLNSASPFPRHASSIVFSSHSFTSLSNLLITTTTATAVANASSFCGAIEVVHVSASKYRSAWPSSVMRTLTLTSSTHRPWPLFLGDGLFRLTSLRSGHATPLTKNERRGTLNDRDIFFPFAGKSSWQ